MFEVADGDHDGNLSPAEFFDWASQSVLAKDLLDRCNEAEVRRRAAPAMTPLVCASCVGTKAAPFPSRR